MILNRREALQAVATASVLGAAEAATQRSNGRSTEDGMRLKVAWLSALAAVDMLNLSSRGEFIALPVTPAIPEGAVVQNIWYDHSRRCFGLLLWHPSFSVSPIGELPPSIDSMIEVESLRRIPVRELYESIDSEKA